MNEQPHPPWSGFQMKAMISELLEMESADGIAVAGAVRPAVRAANSPLAAFHGLFRVAPVAILSAFLPAGGREVDNAPRDVVVPFFGRPGTVPGSRVSVVAGRRPLPGRSPRGAGD